MRSWFPLLVLLLILPTLHASAQVQDAREAVARGEHVVVWQGADWEPLYSRIRGHTIDLRVSVLAASVPSIPEDASVQWRLSRKLAEQHAAEVVVWFDPGALRQGRVVLRIALPRKQRLLERDLGNVADAAERTKVPSVALESAAIIVREALQALIMGELVGTSGSGRFDDVEAPPALPLAPVVTSVAPLPQPEAPALPPPPAAPATTPASAGTQPNNPSRPTRSHQSNWAVGLGLQLSADGFGPLGTTEGLLAEVAWRGPVFELGAMASGNLPVSIRSDVGSVRLTRQQFGLIAGLPLSKSRLGISLGVRLGPTLYRRERLTPSQDATARASATHWLGGAGPVLWLRYPPSNHRFSANLAAGADVVSHRLEVGYQSASEFVVIKRSWPILPFVQLGVTIGF